MTDHSAPRKFIVTTWEGGGSVGPALTVARKLLAAGHDVRVMSDECNRHEAEAAGARFISWNRAPNRSDKSRESEILRDWAGKTPGEGMAQVMLAVCAGPAADYAQDLIDELEREPADLVVASELILGTVLGCEAVHQPCAVLACNSFIFPVAGAPQSGPPMNEEQQQAMAPIFAQLMDAFALATPVFNEARARFGLAPLPNMWDQVLSAQKVLIAISRTFDFGPDNTGDRFAYVGPQLDELLWVDEWQSPWAADDKRPLVLVGFSTTFQNHVGILQRVVDALGQLPVRALVTLGPTIVPDEIAAADNVQLVRSAPHNAVMREADLVITHGGHGTVARAMTNRLPMLVVPHGRDQDGNAARVAAHGAGVMLPPSASVEELHIALSRLLTEPQFREAARKLGDAVAEEAANSRVVEELEALCPAFA